MTDHSDSAPDRDNQPTNSKRPHETDPKEDSHTEKKIKTEPGLSTIVQRPSSPDATAEQPIKREGSPSKGGYRLRAEAPAGTVGYGTPAYKLKGLGAETQEKKSGRAFQWLETEREAVLAKMDVKPVDDKKLPKKKVALMMGYCGTGYIGMQLNPGVPSIELELHKALFAAGAVSAENALNPAKVAFMRAARTDKGVHAAGQVVSLKMITENPNIVEKINQHLPEQIRVWGWVRAAKSFHAKNDCDSRRYEYLLPTYVLAPVDPALYPHSGVAKRMGIVPPTIDPAVKIEYGAHNEVAKSEPEELEKKRAYRATPEQLQRLQQILHEYVGSLNYHNFTHGKRWEESSALRNIKSFETFPPFIRDGIEWVSCKVHGQSFMLHQIRKMIGLAVLMIRTEAGIDLVKESFKREKLNIPKAPGLGLLLEQVVYESYNRKIRTMRGSEAQAIDFGPYTATIEQFKEKYIYTDLVQEELTTAVFDEWTRVVDSRPEDYGWFLNPDGSVALDRRPAYIVERRGGKPGEGKGKGVEVKIENGMTDQDDVVMGEEGVADGGDVSE
ncbi:tRNA pseudouridine synthase 1 [Rhizophlyctis rosea]|uniref:tRNA pseudouridine synthase 1 n=1 Tax=Rhizophlyctis rosea TaxID=64517 RepID=A0AAD5SIU8_9FUNG|nr:tRNA pseudouridine synthase 1 [Rhizophlyctis rosea]